MAKSPKLKVYRTPIGFHDAYVAAPSQKAALEAWGTDTNLFARGVAEIVTDPALSEEPLAQPGKVVKRLRGTEAEQIAALPPNKPRAASAGSKASVSSSPPTKTASPKPKPRPSRAALDTAQAALADAVAKHDAEDRELKGRRVALQQEEQAVRKRHAAEREKLEAARSAAETAYEKAIKGWEG